MFLPVNAEQSRQEVLQRPGASVGTPLGVELSSEWKLAKDVVLRRRLSEGVRPVSEKDPWRLGQGRVEAVPPALSQCDDRSMFSEQVSGNADGISQEPGDQ